MGYSNLCKSIVAINNKCNPRSGNKVVRITPHHMAGVMTGEACAKYHRDSAAQASANYYIGNDGDIVGGVDENNRSWTSSSYDNDVKAITIEVSNSATGGNWPVSAKAFDSLVNLCTDICKRYGFRLSWTGSTSGSLTCHDMFANTNCPGPYLKSLFPELVKRVNANLDGKPVTNPTPQPTQQASAGKKWVQDCVLKVGDKVKSVSCAISPMPGTSSAITWVDGVQCVNCPALGGPVPLKDVFESSDTRDGKCDQYLANTNAKVYLAECTVQKIDAARDLVYVSFGYWVKARPLMALR